MTICLKDCQTHHIQAPPEYPRRILVILILDLLTMKVMATTMIAATPTQAQLILQYLNQDLNPKPNLRTQAKHSPKP